MLEYARSGMRGTWMSVRTFASSVEAHLCRLKLESEGVTSRVIGEMAWALGYVQSSGGIQLEVPAEEADRAFAILAEVDAARAARLAEQKEHRRCPQCAAMDSVVARSGLEWIPAALVVGAFGFFAIQWWPLAILALVAAFAMLLRPRRDPRLRCRACGHRWTPPPPHAADERSDSVNRS